jgi:activator of 2-hydroxyglutaryl-CoA dehydratase
LHLAHVQKTLDALKRVAGKPPVLFTGGVIHNSCIRHLLQDEMKDDILIPEDPDMVGALGAALHAVPEDS